LPVSHFLVYYIKNEKSSILVHAQAGVCTGRIPAPHAGQAGRWLVKQQFPVSSFIKDDEKGFHSCFLEA
jgi:hypothetical protein